MLDSQPSMNEFVVVIGVSLAAIGWFVMYELVAIRALIARLVQGSAAYDHEDEEEDG